MFRADIGSAWTHLSILKRLARWHPMQKCCSRFKFSGNHASYTITVIGYNFYALRMSAIHITSSIPMFRYQPGLFQVSRPWVGRTCINNGIQRIWRHYMKYFIWSIICIDKLCRPEYFWPYSIYGKGCYSSTIRDTQVQVLYTVVLKKVQSPKNPEFNLSIGIPLQQRSFDNVHSFIRKMIMILFVRDSYKSFNLKNVQFELLRRFTWIIRLTTQANVRF